MEAAAGIALNFYVCRNKNRGYWYLLVAIRTKMCVYCVGV